LIAAVAEREGVLRSLQEILDQAASGQGRALFVLGEAGLGKTTIFDRASKLAPKGMAVGTGRADVAEAALPFGLLGQALEDLLGLEVFHPIGGDGRGYQPAPNRLYAILHRLREVAVSPLLIALDDAHWADPDSLTLLRLICRRLVTMPLALVVTARPWPPELARAAEELAEEGLVHLERLSPLTAAAAHTVLSERVGDRARAEEIDAAVASCGGNPLLLAHVAAELEAGHTLPEHGGQAGGSWASRLLLSRFAGVGPAGEAYLRAASVLGWRFRPEVAGEVAGQSPADAAPAIEALMGAGLIIDDGQGWMTFSHHLVRMAVYDQATPQRTHMHETAFRVLRARNAPAAQVAEHAVAAQLASPEAVDALASAGREALQRGAPGTARRHLQAVADRGGDETPSEVLLDLAEALRSVGDNEGAVAICERLLRQVELPAGVRLAGLSELAQAEFRAGYVERAAARIEEAVRFVEGGSGQLATVLLDHAHLSVLRLGPRAALPLANRARAEAAQVGGYTEILGDAVWGECAYLSGDSAGLDAAEAAARRAQMVPERTPEVTQWSDPRSLYAELAVCSERFVEAENLLTDILREAEQNSYPMNLFEGQFLLVEVLRRTGRLHQALTVADQLLASAELMPFSLPLATSAKILVVLELGQLEEAQRWCQRLDEMSTERDRLGRAWTLAHLGRAILALRQGRVEEASRIFGQLERSARRVDLLEPCLYPWAYPAISAHLACGKEDEAARVIEWLEPRAATLPARWPKAVVAAGRAALAERHGDLKGAEEGLVSAVTLHDEAMPLARAEALTDHGAFLLRAGQPARARAVLAGALRLAEDCGAAWHAERARVAWRRAGGRARATPAGSLTPQEQAVANLARAGRTNKEIAAQLYLSVNTVETHLAHVYQKLGISRRWQLMATEDPPRR
jgi:DNA-binding NarL/FixJ family response regulator